MVRFDILFILLLWYLIMSAVFATAGPFMPGITSTIQNVNQSALDDKTITGEGSWALNLFGFILFGVGLPADTSPIVQMGFTAIALLMDGLAIFFILNTVTEIVGAMT